jgi:hypothetical protein
LSVASVGDFHPGTDNDGSELPCEAVRDVILDHLFG